MSKGISVLIVNYNGEKFLKECLQSIDLQLSRGDVPFEILLLDNASTDDSASLLNTLQSRVNHLKLYWSDTNLGFSAANNRLAKHAAYDHLLLLNNDTHTLRLDSLVQLFSETGLDHGTIYTADLLNPDGSPQKSGFNYPSLARIALGLFLLKPLFAALFRFFPKGGKEAYDYYSGCFLVLSKQLFQEVGGFDEQFYFYHEECDLFLRMDQRGVRKEKLAGDVIVHYGGGGTEISAFSFQNYYVNLARLLLKHRYASKRRLRCLFKAGFKWRILLSACKLPINYSPAGHIYPEQGKNHRSAKEIQLLHQSTLAEILKVL